MEKEMLNQAQSEGLFQNVQVEGDIAILRRHSKRRQWTFGAAITSVALLWLYLSSSRSCFSHHRILAPESSTSTWDENAEPARSLIPLEAHIMSKCPDAKVCLRELVLPTMQRVSAKVNFTLSYIGTPTANDGVECKHGAEECMGNIIELCAAHLYPEPRIYLGFVMCMTRDYQDIPQEELVQDCALEHGIDFDKLNDCTSSDDGFGIEMLRKSVTRSKNAGVSTSCTVRLNNEVYCVRDEEWKDCPAGPGVNDLVIAIEKLYNSS